MIAKCVKVVVQPGSGLVCRGVKRDRQDSHSDSSSFKNLGSGRGLYTEKAELFLFIELDGEAKLIQIDRQFRSKFKKPGRAYATLSKKRMERIKETMPSQVNVVAIGSGWNSYQVEDKDIEAWFVRIK